MHVYVYLSCWLISAENRAISRQRLMPVPGISLGVVCAQVSASLLLLLPVTLHRKHCADMWDILQYFTIQSFALSRVGACQALRKSSDASWRSNPILTKEESQRRMPFRRSVTAHQCALKTTLCSAARALCKLYKVSLYVAREKLGAQVLLSRSL